MNEQQRRYKLIRALNILKEIPFCDKCEDAWGRMADSIKIVMNKKEDKERRIYHFLRSGKEKFNLCDCCFARYFYFERAGSLLTNEERKALKGGSR